MIVTFTTVLGSNYRIGQINQIGTGSRSCFTIADHIPLNLPVTKYEGSYHGSVWRPLPVFLVTLPLPLFVPVPIFKSSTSTSHSSSSYLFSFFSSSSLPSFRFNLATRLFVLDDEDQPRHTRHVMCVWSVLSSHLPLSTWISSPPPPSLPSLPSLLLFFSSSTTHTYIAHWYIIFLNYWTS